MSELSYITKLFELDNVEKSEDEDDLYFGTLTIDICTTHKDRVGDVLTKSFIEDATTSLKSNSAFFLNHKTSEHPIGLVKSTETVDYGDGDFGTRLHVGISKTAPIVWQLINEKIYNRGSIGFYIEDWEYDEKTDTFFIIKGEVVEGSLVGIPANDMARTVEISKSLRTEMRSKFLKAKGNTKDNSLKKNIREEINMDEAEIKALIKNVMTEADSVKNAELKSSEEAERLALETKTLNDSIVEKEAKLTEFEKELDVSKKALEKAELEKIELAKALGRKSSASHDDPKDDGMYLDDKDMALKKGFYLLGKVLQDDQDRKVTLYGSVPQDALNFEKTLKEGVQL